jgi:hypothetical protein
VVTFITGPCCWSFLHMAGGSCQQSTLHLFSGRGGVLATPTLPQACGEPWTQC